MISIDLMFLPPFHHLIFHLRHNRMASLIRKMVDKVEIRIQTTVDGRLHVVRLMSNVVQSEEIRYHTMDLHRMDESLMIVES